MRAAGAIVLFLFLSNICFSQDYTGNQKLDNKGRLYFYWGWNWAWYTHSKIHFQGNDYDFTLDKVVAKDRQSKFDADTYLNPANATIPQYNFRIGYFIKNNYNISFGIDHMKYVMVQEQTVKISGNIDNSGTEYDGSYSDEGIVLSDDFLQFEHTDGLNYINIEGRRFDEIFNFNKIRINLTEGIGIGGVYPKTNAKLMKNERYDEFHWAGFGINGVVAVNVSFFKWLFVQTEFKGGYINMPDVRTTPSTSDKANQSFFFGQINAVIGATINTKKKKSPPVDNGA